MIPLFGYFGLANQIGTTDYSRPRRFRAMIEQWLETIRALWPQCPARISADGQAIVLKHAPAVMPTIAAALRTRLSVSTGNGEARSQVGFREAYKFKTYPVLFAARYGLFTAPSPVRFQMCGWAADN